MLVAVLGWLSAIALLCLSLSFAPWYRIWLIEVIGGGYLWLAGFTLLLLLGIVAFKPKLPQRGILVLVLAIALGFYASATLTWYVPRSLDERMGGLPVTVMSYNVNYQLWDTEAVTEQVRANPAELLGLVEPSAEQAAELKATVQDLYPHYYRATGGGLSLFSRYPFLETATLNLGTLSHSLFATVDVNGKPIRVVVTHPVPPISRQHFMRRNQLIRALAKYGAEQDITTIIMGDFNTTSWSLYFHDFLRRSGLRSVNLGHGLNPTWFYNATGRSLSLREQILQVLKIPIDHIIVSQDISVDEVSALPAGVSDHRPLFAKLRLL